MDAETRKFLDDINHQMRTALAGYIFEPSPQMLRERFVTRLMEVVGTHIHTLAKTDVRVTQIGDEIIMELGPKIFEIIRTVYGDDIVAIFAPNAIVTLPGWRRPSEQCAPIQEKNVPRVRVELPEKIQAPIVAVEAEPKKRPKSIGIWRED
jgi:hypothetical protein